MTASRNPSLAANVSLNTACLPCQPFNHDRLRRRVAYPGVAASVDHARRFTVLVDD